MSSTYEQERLARIKQNKERLQSLQIRELADSIEHERAAGASAATQSRQEALGLQAPGFAPQRRSARAAKVASGRRPAKRPSGSRDGDDASDAADSDDSASRSSKSYDPLADDEARPAGDEEASSSSGAEVVSSDEHGADTAEHDDSDGAEASPFDGAEDWRDAHPGLAARVDDPEIQAMAAACGMDVESFFLEQLAAGFDAAEQQNERPAKQRAAVPKVSRKRPSQQAALAANSPVAGIPASAKRKQVTPAARGGGSTGRGRGKKEPVPTLPEIAAGFRLLQPDGGKHLQTTSIIQAVSALGEILDPDMLDDMMSRAADLVEMDGGRLTLQSFQELVHFYCA